VRQYILRRLLQSALILVILSVAVFLMLRIAPGADPARLKCGLMCRPERYEAIREDMGLNDPYFPINIDFTSTRFVTFHGDSQYGSWAKQLVTGSFGRDWNDNAVGPELMRRFPITAELLIITILATVTLGIPFGIISALYRNSPADYAARVTAILGLAVPNFWLATLVLLVPMAMWDYAPPLTETVHFSDDPVGNLRQFVPPAVVLGAVSAAGVMRLTRSSMLEVMRQDYIRTALSKGLQQRVLIVRHALKNSLIPVVTVLGLQIAALFGGAVIIENIFNLPGVGNYFLSALFKRDYPVAQTLTVYIGVAVVSMNLLVDLFYAWLDPRIRYA
jgi:peptide/nickel transport system permease protein